MAGARSDEVHSGWALKSRLVRQALRLALAATLAFAFAEYHGWEFSFLAPMLAVQLLAVMPSGIRPAQALAIPLLLAIASFAALIMSHLFAGNPAALLLFVGLIIFLAFYGERRGASAFAMSLIRIAFCVIPIVVTISAPTGQQLAWFLVLSGIAAAVVVLVAHALIPTPDIGPGPMQAQPGAFDARIAARVALSDTLVLLPLLVAFIIGGDINNIVILIMTLNILRQVDPSRGARLAVGLILGNLIGGAAGVVAHEFIVLTNNFAFFLFAILVPSLWFAGRIVRGGPTAPIYVIGLASFILILGLGVSPLPGASAESFTTRVLKIILASAYAICALSLVSGLRRGEIIAPGVRPELER
jgi:hypothetical protein